MCNSAVSIVPPEFSAMCLVTAFLPVSHGLMAKWFGINQNANKKIKMSLPGNSFTKHFLNEF